ncbi:MAG: dipicolinate synthase subunit DpsA [Clostridia bacterium]|nr:dipicolinate synthase subunit DpsA [Clostridia bacterium]
MSTNKKFLVCGGDLRQVKLADCLVKDGYNVTVLGFDDKCLFSENVVFGRLCEDTVKEADVIILPLPCSKDNKTINTPISNDIINIDELFSFVNPDAVVLGGKITEEIKSLAQFTVYDYLNREEMAIYNAIPTVEGAIEIAIKNTPFTIHGSKILVLGFGRIGKLLCDRFSALGAQVTAEARKVSDLAWIKSYGYIGVPLSALSETIGVYDIIINTIPSQILNWQLLKLVKDDTLIIDLASKPGGVNLDAATKLNKKVIWALSLPGAVAPVTAGIIIKNTILNILDELEATNIGTL